jgi:hypothetical protein
MMSQWVHLIPSSDGSTLADSGSRYIVLHISRLGLANRLRSLADWYQIALLSDRELLVNWIPTVDCYATFQELFDNGPDNFRVLYPSLSVSDESAEREVAQIALESNMTYLNLNSLGANFWMDSSIEFVHKRNYVMSDIQVLFTSYDGVLALEDVTCNQYLFMHSGFLSSLVPNKEARNMVEEIKSKYFKNQIMIGVHYRSHDPLQDWAVVPPFGEGATRARQFEEGASLQVMTMSCISCFK